jgi:phosphoribosylformimino-5-aminoimidazole carboxamide ribotide isomerase
MIVYPAIDVRDGRVVRLRQGDYARETCYVDDPLTLALRYADAGARWLHLVDLDAARWGGYRLQPLLRGIAADGRLNVQTGGGVRSAGDVQALLDAGAQRAVVGSVAIRDPSQVCAWLARFGAERIVVALDTRCDAQGRWQLPVHGWTESGDAELFTLLDVYAGAGARHVLCTDITRDGMLNGPNFELYATLCRLYPTLTLQASGGVRNADDLARLCQLGCAGAVAGKALLEHALSVTEALTC